MGLKGLHIIMCIEQRAQYDDATDLLGDMKQYHLLGTSKYSH